jgi:hypothetical protein
MGSKRNPRSNANGHDASPDFRPIVETVETYFGKELSDCIDELNQAVQVGDGQASFSTTLQIKRAKNGRFKATLTSRVRAPRVPVEIDMHVEDGQLVLGFIEAQHGTGAEEGEGASA